MTDKMKVSGTRIDDLVGAMQRVHGEMGDELEKLTTELDLLSEKWSGEAQQAYAVAQQQWNESMQELHERLDRARRNTQASNDTFADASRTTKRIWSE